VNTHYALLLLINPVLWPILVAVAFLAVLALVGTVVVGGGVLLVEKMQRAARRKDVIRARNVAAYGG
jgi:hypothetical protein